MPVNATMGTGASTVKAPANGPAASRPVKKRTASGACQLKTATPSPLSAATIAVATTYRRRQSSSGTELAGSALKRLDSSSPPRPGSRTATRAARGPDRSASTHSPRPAWPRSRHSPQTPHGHCERAIWSACAAPRARRRHRDQSSHPSRLNVGLATGMNAPGTSEHHLLAATARLHSTAAPDQGFTTEAGRSWNKTFRIAPGKERQPATISPARPPRSLPSRP